ncbi:tetratricopeptide repeat protein [Rosistilla carotiformis]|uniref:tetratricopeptide repeat protein n=1 Tax=Rosistilla carotiformis TaxID=2528017 RepID=UPI0018D26591|nr:tetratricopeptide repeat protein [Rosistilla carotiformis]
MILFARPIHWLETRKTSHLWPALPAAIVIAAVLLPAMLSPLLQGRTAQRYKKAVNEAVIDHDYQTAALFLQKIDGNSPVDSSVQFNRAVVDEALGRSDAALKSMDLLAPEDEFGYGRAHLWKAHRLVASIKEWTPANLSPLIHHLDGAVAEEPNLADAHLLYGFAYHKAGMKSEAIEHLEKIVDQRPEMHLTLADLYDQVSEKSQAKKHFNLARTHLESTLDENPQDVQARIQLALIYFRDEVFAKSEKLLVEGIAAASAAEQKTQVQELTSMLSGLYIRRVDALAAKDASVESQVQIIALLGQALALDPANHAAISRVAEFSRFEGEAGEQAQQLLTKMLAAGHATATAHLVLGTHATQRGDAEKALRHFKQAYRQNPKMPVLLNNVAWFMSHKEPKEYQKALTFSNRAVELVDEDNPMYPYVIETRGQIHAALQHWEQALTDLEQALPVLRGSMELHQALARVYEALGEKALAEEHQRIVDAQK